MNTFTSYIDRYVAAQTPDGDGQAIASEGNAALDSMMDEMVTAGPPAAIAADISLMAASDIQWNKEVAGSAIDEALERVADFGVSECSVAFPE